MLQCSILTRGVTDKDVVTVPQNIAAHDWCGGTVHGEGERLVIPDIPCEGDPEPVNYWETINSRSGVYNSSTQADPRLDGLKVPLKEHAGVGGWGVDGIP